MSATGAVIRTARRRAQEVTLPQIVLRAALGLLLVLAAGLALHALRPALDRPVEMLRVEGRLMHLNAACIAAAAAVRPGTRLFAVRLQAVQSRVEALPWVERAHVSRRWPDALEIRVVERRPLARWNDDALLDTQGGAFVPEKTDLSPAQWNALPQLSGADGQEEDVIDAWRALAPALAGGPFALVGLAQDARGDWIARCASGVVLRLGRGDPTARLGLLRAVVLPALDGKLAQVAAIDLRYTNGFAVADRAAAPDATGAAAQHKRKS